MSVVVVVLSFDESYEGQEEGDLILQKKYSLAGPSFPTHLPDADVLRQPAADDTKHASVAAELQRVCASTLHTQHCIASACRCAAGEHRPRPQTASPRLQL